MRFILEVGLDGDAMMRDQPGELVRCMSKVATQLQDPFRESGNVVDVNGNSIGTWRIVEDDQ